MRPEHLPARIALVANGVGMMVIYLTSGTAAMRNPMFMFFPIMMLVSLLGTLAVGARGGNRTAEINQGRRDYLRYIESLEQTVATTIEAQRASLTWNHPDPGSLWTLVGGRRMWERRREDPESSLERRARRACRAEEHRHRRAGH